jgi:hypothetical protein
MKAVLLNNRFNQSDQVVEPVRYRPWLNPEVTFPGNKHSVAGALEVIDNVEVTYYRTDISCSLGKAAMGMPKATIYEYRNPASIYDEVRSSFELCLSRKLYIARLQK